MTSRFTLLDVIATVKQLATEDMPKSGAPYEEWTAWRERWSAGLAEVTAAMTSDA